MQTHESIELGCKLIREAESTYNVAIDRPFLTSAFAFFASIGSDEEAERVFQQVR